MEIISENEVINAFNLVIPYLQIFLDNEASIAISDTEKYLQNVACAAVPSKGQIGDPITEGGSCETAIKEGRPIIRQNPHMKSFSVPVKGKNGKVEGCLIVAKSQKKRTELLDLSKKLSAALQQISEVTNDFSAKLQAVVEMNNETSKKIDEAQNNVSSTDKIFNFIHQVASQTDLLGINAAIEATRAGAEGKGFKVIAQEIRSLSETSRESVDKIYYMLNAINKSVDEICNMTSKTQDITAGYSTAFADIAASVQQLSSSAQHLEAMADKV